MHALRLLGTIGLAAGVLSSIPSSTAFADEVPVARPTFDGRRIERCAQGEGAARCESAARERVADAACRLQGEDYTGAVDGSVRYEGSLLPRSVAVWSDRLGRFVEARGVDVIASVVCVRESAPKD